MLQKYEDLEVLERLDTTHGGTTQIVIGKYEGQLVVCKSIEKQSLRDSKSIEHVKNEKEVLQHFSKKQAKGINKIIHTFQDSEKLHIVLEPVKGLPLHKLLQMVQKFNQTFAKIVVSQIGLILKSFHDDGFIYRDIKASNFMINEKGRVTLIDMGHAKRINKDRTYTICGTVHSMPPEIYDKEGYSYQFDYYGFGILIYELLVGKAPFGYNNTNPNIVQEMKKGITQEHLSLIQCDTTKELIQKLLQKPANRLGSKGGFGEILQHQYFNVPDFLTAKDIYEGEDSLDSQDPAFEVYLSEIEDFGIQDYKFEQVSQNDPFYKFYE